MRVVLAEDLTLLRDGLVRLLQEHGFEVVAADPTVVAKLELQASEDDNRRVLAVLAYLEG